MFFLPIFQTIFFDPILSNQLFPNFLFFGKISSLHNLKNFYKIKNSKIIPSRESKIPDRPAKFPPDILFFDQSIFIFDQQSAKFSQHLFLFDHRILSLDNRTES
jgi:hypothetical protein